MFGVGLIWFWVVLLVALSGCFVLVLCFFIFVWTVASWWLLVCVCGLFLRCCWFAVLDLLFWFVCGVGLWLFRFVVSGCCFVVVLFGGCY